MEWSNGGVEESSNGRVVVSSNGGLVELSTRGLVVHVVEWSTCQMLNRWSG